METGRDHIFRLHTLTEDSRGLHKGNRKINITTALFVASAAAVTALSLLSFIVYYHVNLSRSRSPWIPGTPVAFFPLLFPLWFDQAKHMDILFKPIVFEYLVS